jgi:hypothetical protein
MAKVGTSKKTKRKPSGSKQYGRFLETVRDLGIDERKSREAFEEAFKKIVPSKRSRAR